MEEVKTDSEQSISEIFERNKGVIREFKPFRAIVLDNMNIRIESESKWAIEYPAYCETWAFIMMWLDSWEEENIASFGNFVKGIVFPCSMRLSDVDVEYASDIMSAHERLTERVSERKENEDGVEE